MLPHPPTSAKSKFPKSNIRLAVHRFPGSGKSLKESEIIPSVALQKTKCC